MRRARPVSRGRAPGGPLVATAGPSVVAAAATAAAAGGGEGAAPDATIAAAGDAVGVPGPLGHAPRELRDNTACLWALEQVFSLGSNKGELPVAVPDTLLYEGGAPRRWMRLSDDPRAPSMIYKEVDPRDPRALLEAVLCFNTRYRKCLVWYASGTCEELLVSALFEVFSSVEWQRQVVCVQGYAEPGTGEQVRTCAWPKRAGARAAAAAAATAAADGDPQPQRDGAGDAAADEADLRPALDELVAWLNKFGPRPVSGLRAALQLDWEGPKKPASPSLLSGDSSPTPASDPRRAPKSLLERPIVWLRFVDRLSFEAARPRSSKAGGAAGGAAALPPDAAAAAAATVAALEGRPGAAAVDTDFGAYYKMYCASARVLLDVVFVEDVLEPPSAALEALYDAVGREGMRVWRVRLVREGRCAAEPPSNVLLSNWLAQLLVHLNVGQRGSPPLLLAGAGVGANVAMHAAAYRKLDRLQCLMSLNGFAFVDRTLLRTLSQLAEGAQAAAGRAEAAAQAAVTDAADKDDDAALAEAQEALAAAGRGGQAAKVLQHARNGFLDLRPSLGIVKTPMVVVQSTEDSVVLPLHVEAVVNARGAPRTICSALQECVRHQGAVKSHVVWLKAAHDVVAERQAFVKQLFFSLFAALKVVNKVPEPPKPQELALAAELKAQEEAAAKAKKEQEEAAAKRAAEDGEAGNDSSGDEAERREPGPAHDKDKQRAVEDKDKDKGKDKDKKKRRNNKGAGSGAGEGEGEGGPATPRRRDKAAEHARKLAEQRERDKAEAAKRRADFLKFKPTEAEERSMMMDADAFSKELRRCGAEEERWAAQRELVRTRMAGLNAVRQAEAERSKLFADRETARLKNSQAEADFMSAESAAEEASAAAAFSDARTVLGSSVSGASKIRLDFLRTAQRQAVAIERSKQILAVVRETEKSRDASLKRLSELDRAVAMLRSAATLRNPGQASRKKQRRAEEAARELVDVAIARDETGAVVQAFGAKLKQLLEEVSKVNGGIQSDAIIISRKAAELEDMVAKLERLLEALGAEEKALRDARTQGAARQADMAALRDGVKARRAAVTAEIDRVRTLKAKYCDSSVWQSGVLQRVRTVELLRFLGRELEGLDERLEALEGEVEAQAEVQKKAEGRTATLLREKAAVHAQYTLISGALQLHRSGEIKKRAKVHANAVLPAAEDDEQQRQKQQKQQQQQQQQTASKAKAKAKAKGGAKSPSKSPGGSADLSAESLGVGGPDSNDEESASSEESSLMGQTNLAMQVRRTPSSKRTMEEREWVALDMVVNRVAKYYPEEDIKAYAHYKPMELTDEVVDGLFELPEELNLALPFIRSEAQLKAWDRIQKFSFGNDSEALAREDRLRAAARRRHAPALAAARLAAERRQMRGRAANRVSAEEQRLMQETPTAYRVFPSMEAFKIIMQEEGREDASIDRQAVLLRKQPWERLYAVDGQVLAAREGRVHTFFLPPELTASQLIVNVVFEGGFDNRGYVLGRISAGLYFEEETPLGYLSRKHDLKLCTNAGMGRFSLLHDPNDAGLPLASGRYQVVVGAASLSRYSLTVLVETCETLATAEASAKQEALAILERLGGIATDAEHLTVSLYLSERKAALVDGMLAEAEAKCEALENECAKIAYVLEMQKQREERGLPPTEEEETAVAAAGGTSRATRNYLVQREAEFDKWVRLAGSRRREQKDTRGGSQEMAELKRRLAEEVVAKTKRLEDLRRLGVVSDAELSKAEADRKAQARERARLAREARAKAASDILKEQPHASACWASLDRLLHPRSESVDGGPSVSTNGGSIDYSSGSGGSGSSGAFSALFSQGSSSQAGSLPPAPPPLDDQLCCREDLLALMCTAPTSLRGPKAVALCHLLRDRATPEELECLEHPMLSEPRMLRRARLDVNVKAPDVERDVDQRCRNVLAELERANASREPSLDSVVLHGTHQRFPARILRKELNRELDRLLVLQVKEQERFLLKEWRKSLRASLPAQSQPGLLSREEALALGVTGPGCEDLDSSEDESEARSKVKADAISPKAKAQNAAASKAAQRAKQAKLQPPQQDAVEGEGGGEGEGEGDVDAQIDKELGLQERRQRPCRACKTAPCQWKPAGDMVKIQERVVELHIELKAVRLIDESVKFVESRVVKAALQNPSAAAETPPPGPGGGPASALLPQLDAVAAPSAALRKPVRMLREDLLRDLQIELLQLQRQERLLLVDEELHEAYASNKPFIETKALHGYRQVQWTQNVIAALEKERSRLIGQDAVANLVDGMLQHMLDGWVFGEREANVEDIIRINRAIAGDTPAQPVVRRTPEEQWTSISAVLASRHRKKKAVELKEDVSHQLGETENVLRFGLFTMTLMYFRAMTLLKKSRFDGLAAKRKADRELPSAERLAMDRAATRRDARQRAMERALAKAAAGEKRRAELQESVRAQQANALRRQLRKVKMEARAARNVQRLFRGYLGRGAARKWAARKMERLAQESLEFAAAAAIQRVFRGYQGRKVVEDKRHELSEFISQVRAAEAKEEDEEYWRRNPIRNVLRKAKMLFKTQSAPALEDVDATPLKLPQPVKKVAK